MAGNDVETPRFTERLDLAAVATAVSCARMFTEVTLVRWRARRILDTALEAVADLVATSVSGSQEGDVIQVRLVGLEAAIRIEVRDPRRYPPESLTIADSTLSHGAYSEGHGRVLWREISVL